ncbi:MAG: hypothetical protein ACTHWH_01745 [Marinobacter sp.]
MTIKTFSRIAVLATLPPAMAAVPAQANKMAIATILPENMSNNSVYPALIRFKDLVKSRTDQPIGAEVANAKSRRMNSEANQIKF